MIVNFRVLGRKIQERQALSKDAYPQRYARERTRAEFRTNFSAKNNQVLQANDEGGKIIDC